MAADIARITYDPTREYRAVVRQQGRVTLEADENEAATLASEALRLETIDIFGPTAAIGDGYLVGSASGPGGISIHNGTFYLGGWRLELDKVLELPGDPKAANPLTGNFVVALLLTEQTVGAVEDTALREVALGGPDTAARTRLMQHFIRQEFNGDTCTDGQQSINTALANEGVTIEPATLQLVSSATLQAGFVPGPSSQDPCTPNAAGGYLGADNQLVRVTVIEYDGKATGKLLWGWNNASLLYRATPSGTTLTLNDTPVDQEHAPQKNQMVEILFTELDLHDGNYIAAQQGHVTSVQDGYAPDNGTIVLQDLPVNYQNATNPLFVRLWQDEVTFQSGKVANLGDASGITVTITMPAVASGPNVPAIAARPFWHFAVRPSMPQNIYPERYSDGPVPPDGPRQWIAKLAVMTALPGGGSQLLHDCRTPYPAAEAGCCSLTLDPGKDWLGALNAAISDSKIVVVNVCFLAGEFEVARTIKISGKSVRMTGAGFRSVILGRGLEVVMQFDKCPEVGLSDLSVSAGTAGFSASTNTKDLQGAVTISSCMEVNIERVAFTCSDADLRSASCLAIYNPAPSPNPAPEANLAPRASVTRYVNRVLNCRFYVGCCQAGILITNADIALIEGNDIENKLALVKVTIDQLATRPQIASRLRKQVIHEMVLTNTAPPTSRNTKASARKREAKGRAVATARRQEVKAAPAAAAARTNLATIGRAHVTATFGNIHLKLLSSSTLTDAWAGALRASGITATSTMGAIHDAVQAISRKMVTNPREVSPAVYNYFNALLPQLYSTASQGIVVGGNIANDVRILNNTIDGMVQGIHVGLSNVKQFGKRSGHLSATRVQVRGNTVNVRLCGADMLDRHGIYLGCVNSAVIADNHLTLTRVPNEQVAWQAIDGIKVSGIFGPLMLIERNCMLGFSNGIYTQENQTPSLQVPPLWKAADNYSDIANQIHAPPFIVTNTVP
jgi:hypothetical protein